ncbi:rta1 domain-containing protein [Fusarium phyllophilum]|uniref:Rta1 domain-containing protein n=1 Tax=Fusarium phyllophilum TaxID=47803 RepID=A0A8H5K8L9_9HYPO|nr:rta1 domain-containing protein [Fusarium phyllophilum]
MQIICLIIAPSFIAAGIYLTMKHFIQSNNPEYSFLKPQLYTWIFIGCDVGSILLQAAGGGIAGSAGSENQHLLDIGNNVMIAGIAFQVVTMVICGVLPRSMLHVDGGISTGLPLPEMAGGWGNELMRNEMEFLVLDGLMVALASVALTIVHPAFFLPVMRTTRSEEKAYSLTPFANNTVTSSA